MVTTALAPQLTALSDAPSASEVSHHFTTLQDDERALLRRVVGQDQQAFAMLYARYAAPVRRYLRRCLAQADLVDDVLQEVMLVLWQCPSSCPSTVPLTAWLCGIARHKARKAVPPPVLPLPHTASAVDDPARLLLWQEDKRRLARALDTLPFNERTALRLLVQQGYTYPEIAAVMDTSLSTVRTRIWRASHRLRALMAAGDPRSAAPAARPQVCRAAQTACPPGTDTGTVRRPTLQWLRESVI